MLAMPQPARHTTWGRRWEKHLERPPHGKLCQALQHSGICGRRPLAPSHSDPSQGVGGVETLPGSWPWMVSLRAPSKSGFQHTCGGSLVSAKWILTAAHCFKGRRHLTNWELVLGASELSRPGPDAAVRFPKRVVVHGNYKPHYQVNDLALIELDDPILCNDYIQPACLPDASVNMTTMVHCYITGWGYTQEKSESPSNILKEAKVDLIPIQMCNSTNWYYGSITTSNLCAGYEGGGIDTCQGDSGGPLQCREDRSERYWLVGVTSWGLGCGRAQKPGVYISTQQFYNWIQGHIKAEVVQQASPTPLPHSPPTQMSTETETPQTQMTTETQSETTTETSTEETSPLTKETPPLQPTPVTHTPKEPPTTSQAETMSTPPQPPGQPPTLLSLRGPGLPVQDETQDTSTTLAPATTSTSTTQSTTKRKHTMLVFSGGYYGSKWGSQNWAGDWPASQKHSSP